MLFCTTTYIFDAPSVLRSSIAIMSTWWFHLEPFLLTMPPSRRIVAAPGAPENLPQVQWSSTTKEEEADELNLLPCRLRDLRRKPSSV